MAQVTGNAASSSVLEAYSVELRRLAATITGFLEVAERRSDLSSPNDARALADMSEVVNYLGRRLTAFATRTRTALPPGFIDPEEPDPMESERDSQARRLKSLVGPAVQGSVGETVGGQFGVRHQEFAHWFSHQPRSEGNHADHTPGTPRDVGPVGQRFRSGRGNAPVASTELLSHLLATIGSEVAMKGTTESMAMPLVFDFLVRLKRTGCLHVQTSTEHTRFVFVEGMIVATATDNQPTGQRIGEILRQLGLLPRRHMTRLIERAESEKRPLGRLLVDEQLVTIPQITKALTIQIQARFERAFNAGRAAFAFVPNGGERIDDRICVDARALLTEMRRRTTTEAASPEVRTVPRDPA